MQSTNNSHKTAMSRKQLSAPMKWLHKNGYLSKAKMLDFGCGKGDDVRYLKEMDYPNVVGYDPYHGPKTMPDTTFDVITCIYVLNTLKSADDRATILHQIAGLLSSCGKAYLVVRNDVKNLNGFTKKGTWQGKVDLNLYTLVENGVFKIYQMKKSSIKDKIQM